MLDAYGEVILRGWREAAGACLPEIEASLIQVRVVWLYVWLYVGQDYPLWARRCNEPAHKHTRIVMPRRT